MSKMPPLSYHVISNDSDGSEDSQPSENKCDYCEKPLPDGGYYCSDECNKSDKEFWSENGKDLAVIHVN